MSDTRKDHRYAKGIGGLYDILVLYGAAGLYNSCDTRLCGHLYSVGFWEEGVTCQGGAFGAVARLPRCDDNGIDP